MSNYDCSYFASHPGYQMDAARQRPRAQLFNMDLIKQIKNELKSRVPEEGFNGLQRQFRLMDSDDSKSLDFKEFKNALKEMDIIISHEDCKALFDSFDLNSNGTIDFEEFIEGVRDPMPPHRLALVEMAFAKLDIDGNGVVDVEEISTMYNASKHPEVLAGRMSAREALAQFINNFEVGGEVDGVLTKEEFINYYANLSASINQDDYFELMIRNAWHISGGSGMASSSANKRVLVTDAVTGRQYVQEVFDDLGMEEDRRILMLSARLESGNQESKNSLLARLQQQGISNIGKVEIYGGYQNNDHDSSPSLAAARRNFANGATSQKSPTKSPSQLSPGSRQASIQQRFNYR